MGLFGFGNKKQKNVSCACQADCPVVQMDETEYKQMEGCTQGQSILIEVLGTGCASCHRLLENTKEAVQHMGMDAQVEYVQDMEQIVSYGVMSVPALVVQKNVVCMGKVLKTDDIEKILKKFG